MPPINEDWRVGDLAECIISQGWDGRAPGPVSNEVQRVLGVKQGRRVRDGTPAWGLRLTGYTEWFDAAQFRKIIVRHEPADAEFADRVKRPVRQPVLAETPHG